MSNNLLGNVYSKVMEDVIENCQTTFEEDGVSHQTLQDLKTTWQNKLTALRVGTFPWDPAPTPQPMANPTVPSNVPRPSQVPSNGASLGSSATATDAGPRIKTEPGFEPGLPNLPPNYGNNDARERAMANLEQKFGADAKPQINQIQKQMIPNSTTSPSSNEQQKEQQVDYARRQQAQMTQQMQQSRAQPVTHNGQTDGTDDWTDLVAKYQAEDGSNAAAIDLSIRERLEQMNRSMEGGGLMLPVSEQRHIPHKRRRLTPSTSSHQVPQYDGIDDASDDEDKKDANIKDDLFGDEDNDAINSDLDDPEEAEIEEDEDEGKPTQVMLCTYDKVQRVKNKWKCTLRDGVLNSGGKEYVFNKANGEFEW